MATNRRRHTSGHITEHITGRIAWLFHPRTSPAERQMRSFRDCQAALARACSANRPHLHV